MNREVALNQRRKNSLYNARDFYLALRLHNA